MNRRVRTIAELNPAVSEDYSFVFSNATSGGILKRNLPSSGAVLSAGFAVGCAGFAVLSMLGDIGQYLVTNRPVINQAICSSESGRVIA